MFYRRSSVEDRGLQIVPAQLGVTSQNGFPRFSARHLIQKNHYGNPRAVDHRLAPTDARADFDSIHHRYYSIMPPLLSSSTRSETSSRITGARL